MEPISGILGALKVLGDLGKTLQGKEKERVEILKERMELVKDQVTAISGERDKFKSENAELTKEIKELRDQVAIYTLSVSDEFETGYNGLLYKKGTTERPYCPKDAAQMVMIKNYLGITYECPVCKQTGCE